LHSVQASGLPISIIIVGIGGADFEGLLFSVIYLQSFTTIMFFCLMILFYVHHYWQNFDLTDGFLLFLIKNHLTLI